MHPQVTPIQLTGGSVAIGGRPVLRGIDLTVVSGEFLADVSGVPHQRDRILLHLHDRGAGVEADPR